MTQQDDLHDFVNNPENLKRAVEGSMEKRQAVFDAGDEELLNKITKLMHPVSYEVIYPETQSERGYPIAKNILNFFRTREATLIREAEIRGTAFAIQQIDYLHMLVGSENDTVDHIFKGLKNDIRNKFKEITGIDPAPNYPIEVELTNQQKGEKT